MNLPTLHLSWLHFRPPTWWREALLYFAGALGAFLLVLLVIGGYARLAVMLGLTIPLICLAMIRVQLAIFVMVVYLVLLGDLRRILIPVVGWTGQDPLLLVGTGFAILVFGYAWASKSIKLDTPLARWTMLLIAIMVLQIFNPVQGGLIVGVAGVMFLMVPLFWYWIGRTYMTPALMHAILYKAVVPLGVAAMIMGYYQVFVGYLPYQMDWYWIAGYGSLGDPKTGLAPISFFASGTEHGSFLITTIAVLWALVLVKKQRVALLLILPVLVAVFLTGSRGPVAKVLVVCCAMWAVMGKSYSTWMTRGVLAIVLAAGGLVWSLTQATQMNVGGPVQKHLDRQAEEFVHAASGQQEYSSAGNHFSMMLEGYIYAVQHPLGFGLGATDKSASKYGGRGHSTETDMGNSLIATGLFGGAIYHLMVFMILGTTIRYWHRTRSVLALALMGVLGVNFLMWLGGGQYAICPLVWLCIGALDRFENMGAGEPDSLSHTRVAL